MYSLQSTTRYGSIWRSKLKKAKNLKAKRLKSQDGAKRLLANCLFSTMHTETVGRVLKRVAELAQRVSCYELEFPLNVWLDKEIEQTEFSRKKKKQRPRMSWPEGSDFSALHRCLPHSAARSAG